jgi:hypothetical protein
MTGTKSIARITLLLAGFLSIQATHRAHGFQDASGMASPATAPSTAPVVKPNPSTPRGALKALLIASDAGEADTVRALLHPSTELERLMIDAIATRAAAEKRFRAAAEKAFGPEGMLLLVPDTRGAMVESMAKLDVAKETVNGDTATVSGLDESSPDVTLKQLDGSWKIPVNQFARGSDEEVRTRLDEERMAVEVINESTEEVSAGKFKTPAEATEAIRTKIVVATSKRAASRPTTGPSDEGKADPTTRPN